LFYSYIYETNKGGLRISEKGGVGLKGNMNNERLVAFFKNNHKEKKSLSFNNRPPKWHATKKK